MRRSTDTVEPILRLPHPLAAPIGELDSDQLERCIEVLEPLVRDPRKARLHANIERRVGSVSVLLDSFHDPHNGAAILRSCDAFGLARLHVIERWESFLAARSVSRGSEHWVDIVAHRDEASAIAYFDQGPPKDPSSVMVRPRWIATHPDGELGPEDLAAMDGPFLLVFGNERDGIGPGLANRCDARVRVPMRGYAESLNVSVTAAILLYSATRRRLGDLDASEKRRLYLRGLAQSAPRAMEVLAARGIVLSPSSSSSSSFRRSDGA